MRTVSYLSVLRGDIPPDELRGKYVLVGAWATGLGDAYPTPVSHDVSGMSGVEIIANLLHAAREDIATCAISGAVGTFANIDPAVEEHVCAQMGLTPEPISTQVIPRDRHAMFFATLGVIASSIENVAIEIRHMQRTEVLEAEEFFSPGQKGSSAMPHKRNPVLTENLTGLARLVRSAVIPALENVALWHERDISHSSVERGIGPDATIHLDFALHRLAGVIERLNVYPDNMQKNLDRLGGLVFSQRVMLALTQAGVSREDAYAAVQENAMKVWRGEGAFLDFLKADDRVTLPADQLERAIELVGAAYRRATGGVHLPEPVVRHRPVSEQEAAAEASKVIAAAEDWPAVARCIRRGRGPAYIPRRKESA